jgi:putative colanic acid biosynthesis acetyltransferase WcaF
MNTENASWIDVRRTRKNQSYTWSEQLRRVVWSMVEIIFRLTPRPFFRVRNALLRLMGAKIGKGVHIYSTARITMPWNLAIGDDSAIGEDTLIYNLGKVTIGKRAIISHRSQLCAGTHDYKDTTFPLIRATITIADEVWVGTQALVCPFVTIGPGAIVGAGAVVTKDVPAAAIVAGNPACQISTRAEKVQQ